MIFETLVNILREERKEDDDIVNRNYDFKQERRTDIHRYNKRVNSYDVLKSHFDPNYRPQNRKTKTSSSEEWHIEFECPSCGKNSEKGIRHNHFQRHPNHISHGIYLRCDNCGWKSNLINIKALN